MGCDVIEDLIEDLVGGLDALCSAPEFLVTKVDDTNDGLCSADDCSLREAIVMANGCPGHQTIRVPIGTYVLSRHGADEDDGDTGDLDITDDVDILGNLSDLGYTLVWIDGDAADRVFEIHDPAVVHLENMVINNGQEQEGSGIFNKGDLTVTHSIIVENHGLVNSIGGGIYTDFYSSTTIVDCEVNSNSAEYGGALATMLSELVVTDSIILGNVATANGGGIWIQVGASAVLNDVDVESNTATDEGGGIFNDGTFEMTGGNITRNEAARGGGLYNSDMIDPPGPAEASPAEAMLSMVTIDFNIAEEAGAGIWNGANFELHQAKISQSHWPEMGGGMYNGPDGEAFLYDAWFTNNTADLGGGVYNQGLIHVYRGSFTVNSAMEGLGGAIYNDGAMPGVLLRNTTVSGNMADPDAPSGAGIYNHGGDLNIGFSTFAYNSHDAILNDAGGHVAIESTVFGYQPLNCTGVGSPSGGYNIDSQNSCGFIESTDMVDTDPLLTWLAHNGAVGLSHAPASGSPAVDTGDPSTCTAVDQRSVARPQGAGCDRGSIELTDDPILPPEEPLPEDPLSMDFYDDGDYLILGQCTTLHWEVLNAEAVMLNFNPVDPQGHEYVCPQSTTTYILLAWNLNQQAQEAITIEVDYGAPPATPAQFSIGGRICDQKLYRVTLNWIDMADNETGFRIYRDGQLLDTLGPDIQSYVDDPPRGVPHTYGVEAFNPAGASARPTLNEGVCQ
jgi:CSLREA domain-containing protein